MFASTGSTLNGLNPPLVPATLKTGPKESIHYVLGLRFREEARGQR
jgi:hypothetical protein